MYDHIRTFFPFFGGTKKNIINVHCGFFKSLAQIQWREKIRWSSLKFISSKLLLSVIDQCVSCSICNRTHLLITWHFSLLTISIGVSFPFGTVAMKDKQSGSNLSSSDATSIPHCQQGCLICQNLFTEGQFPWSLYLWSPQNHLCDTKVLVVRCLTLMTKQYICSYSFVKLTCKPSLFLCTSVAFLAFPTVFRSDLVSNRTRL